MPTSREAARSSARRSPRPALAGSPLLWKQELTDVAHGDGHHAHDEVAQPRRRGFDARQVGGTQLHKHVLGEHVVGQVEQI